MGIDVAFGDVTWGSTLSRFRFPGPVPNTQPMGYIEGVPPFRDFRHSLTRVSLLVEQQTSRNLSPNLGVPHGQ